MDYTAILSRLESLFSGNSGVFLIAAIGVGGIIGAHFLRMKSSRGHKSQKLKSYQHMIIAPYVEDEHTDPAHAMMPHFSPETK